MKDSSNNNPREPLILEEKVVSHFHYPPQPPQISLFKDQIILNPSISKLNFFTFLVFGIYVGIVIIPINLLQVPLLAITYKLSSNDQKTVNTVVQITQLILQIPAAALIGYLCDRFGRKFLIVVGVVFISLSTGLLPVLPSIYPYYVLILVLQCIGFLCVSIPPLLADYIDYETKGRVSGLANVLANVGAFISTSIEEQGNLEDSINTKFYEFAVITLVLGIIISLGLKGGQYHKKLRHDLKAEEAKRSIISQGIEVYDGEDYSDLELSPEEPHGVNPDGLETSEASNRIDNILSLPDSQTVRDNSTLIMQRAEQGNQNIRVNPEPHRMSSRISDSLAHHDQNPGIIAGLREAKNPWICIGYICNFLWFSTMSLLGFPFVTYVVGKTGDQNSASQAYSLTNKQLMVAICFAIIFGYCADKYDKFKQVTFIIVSSTISIILLLFMPSPYHATAYVSMFFYGIASSGLVVFSNQLLSKYPTPKFRASVMSVGIIFAVFGAGIINTLGVYLSRYDVLIPFYIYLGYMVISAIIMTVLYITQRKVLKSL